MMDFKSHFNILSVQVLNSKHCLVQINVVLIGLVVYQVTTLQHRTYFAMKKISKQHVVAKKQEAHILLEKKILLAIQCDFIVRLVQLST